MFYTTHNTSHDASSCPVVSVERDDTSTPDDARYMSPSGGNAGVKATTSKGAALKVAGPAITKKPSPKLVPIRPRPQPGDASGSQSRPPSSQTVVRSDGPRRVSEEGASVRTTQQRSPPQRSSAHLNRQRNDNVNVHAGADANEDADADVDVDDEVMITSETADASQESDAIETLTHLGDRGGDKQNSKSPHVGKGILKVPCRVCKGPIAVKVSADLRTLNKNHDDQSKICQKCFNKLLLAQQRADGVALMSAPIIQNELSFPWAVQINQYTCTQPFSENYNFTVGENFQIIYTYTMEKCISILITVSKVNDDAIGTVDLIAQAPADEFLAMKMHLGRDGYHNAVYNNEGLGSFEWKWFNIPKQVLFHSRLLSSFQELSGTIKSCNVMFANAENEHYAYTTTEDAHPVLYPFLRLLDFPIVMKEKVRMELVACSGKIVDTYTHVVFEKGILTRDSNIFGINIVALDKNTETVYMSMKYVAFGEMNGKPLAKLLRVIFKAPKSDLVGFSFLNDEYIKFAWNPNKIIGGSNDFRVLTHLHNLFSKELEAAN